MMKNYKQVPSAAQEITVYVKYGLLKKYFLLLVLPSQLHILKTAINY